jgi:FixJ family two-component response regulator
LGGEQRERRGHVPLRAGGRLPGDALTAIAPVVFVVDDDASVRRGLQRLLASAGYRVRVFATGRELLADPGAGDPCCFVLDVRMPGQGGLALHEALLAAGYRCPVVFITGDGEIPSGTRGAGSGTVTVLAKPVDEGDLLDAIQRMITRPVVDDGGAC